MMTIILFVLLSACCLAIEFIKSKWSRWLIHMVVLGGSLVIVFNLAWNAGDTTARASREIQDVIDIVLDSSKTNTIDQLQAKLVLTKAEMPKVIVENDRMPLLKALNIIP